MSVYANGLNIQMNEAVFLIFKETSQAGETNVASVVVTYDNIKAMHEVIGQCIQQYEAKVHEVKSTKASMN